VELEYSAVVEPEYSMLAEPGYLSGVVPGYVLGRKVDLSGKAYKSGAVNISKKWKLQKVWGSGWGLE
jgi:hypothetical protein